MTNIVLESKPLVSCIIIFLNEEKYLEEAIASILAQTYNHWELLLVDDGSTDSSPAIAQQYAEKYPNQIFYLHHPNHANKGMSATRNLGIDQARGEYIAFLDGDDVWLPEKLAKQLTIFQTNPSVDMVCGPTEFWYSWASSSPELQRGSMRQIGKIYNQVIEPPHLLTLLLANQAKTPATCSVLIKSTLFKKIGKFEEKFRGMYEDQVFFAKVYLFATVFISDQCYDRYRQHPDNCTIQSEQSGTYNPFAINPSHLKFLHWLAEYLAEQNIKDQEIHQQLQKRLWEYRHPILYYLTKPHLILISLLLRLITVEMRNRLSLKYQQLKRLINQQ